MIAPPYSVEFIAGMLPIVQNEQVTSALKLADGEDDVSKFLGTSGVCCLPFYLSGFFVVLFTIFIFYLSKYYTRSA